MARRSRTNYEIGYGKPPRNYCYAPGRSGNPRGRPKGLPEISRLLAKEFKRKRIIVEDGQRLSVATIHILVKRLIDVAAKGSLPALMRLLELADQLRAKERRSEVQQITRGMTEIEAAAAYARAIGADPDSEEF